MSLMAGFDVVIEISKGTIERMIKSSLKINNTVATPPFEFSVPFSSPLGATGIAHLIVKDPVNGIQLKTLAFLPHEMMVLRIAFTDSSVIVGNFVASPLSGSIDVSVILRVTAQNETPPNHLIADFGNPNSSSSVTLDTPSAAFVKEALTKAGLPFSMQEFTDVANTSVQNFLSGLGPKSLYAFAINSQQVGNLLTPQFVSLVNHNIFDGQALGLFGMLFPWNQAGNPELKITTTIQAGQDVAMSISPQIFHEFFFCPAVMKKFNVPSQSELPASCGSAGGLDYHDARITNVSDSLDEGHVNIDGSIEKSGFCYSASGPFHVEVQLQVSGNTIVPQPGRPQSGVSVDLDWYCVLASLAVGGYIDGIIGEVVAAVVDEVVKQIADAVASTLAPDVLLKPKSLPQLFPGLTMNAVLLHREGLIIQGTVTLPLVIVDANPAIEISASVVTTESEIIGMGSYSYICAGEMDCKDCPSQTFPYQEQTQGQTITLQAIPYLLGTPIVCEWAIGFDWNKIKLDHEAQRITMQVTANYALPLPGGTYVTEQAHIICKRNNDVLTLIALPCGNYTFGVYLTATDPTGLVLHQYASVQVQGDVILFGPEYDSYMKACAINRLGRMSRLGTVPQTVPPEGKWNPDDVITLVQNVAVLGSAVQESVLAQASMRFGPQVLTKYASGVRPSMTLVGQGTTLIKQK